MVASRQVEIPYYRGVGRQKWKGFGALAQVIGRTAIPYLRKWIVPAAKRIGADMLEFATPEIGEVVSGRETLKSSAKSVGKQTLKKRLGSGSKQRRVIRTKSTKQSSRSRWDIFKNISCWPCQTTIFGTNILWQCLEILETKSQLLTMSCLRMNNKFILLPHLMKTAYSLKFKRIGTFMLIWDSLSWHWSSNLSKDVLTIHTRIRKRKRSTRASLLFSLKQAMLRKKEVTRVTYVNKIKESIFSNVEVYINN